MPFIVNTSRGEVIDENALAAHSLEAGDGSVVVRA